MSTPVSIAHVFESVCKWNAQRYDRVYDHKLSIALLEEELCEYYEAKNTVDQLDALCDTIYVAMGVLWKINVNTETLEINANDSHIQAVALVDSNTLEPVDFAYAVLTRCKYDNTYPVALAAQMLITLCTAQASAFGLSTPEVIESLLVVCDSNDSKSIKKVAPHIKANAGDKGPYFVPPEPRLQAIIDKASKRHGFE